MKISDVQFLIFSQVFAHLELHFVLRSCVSYSGSNHGSSRTILGGRWCHQGSFLSIRCVSDFSRLTKSWTFCPSASHNTVRGNSAQRRAITPQWFASYRFLLIKYLYTAYHPSGHHVNIFFGHPIHRGFLAGPGARIWKRNRRGIDLNVNQFQWEDSRRGRKTNKNFSRARWPERGRRIGTVKKYTIQLQSLSQEPPSPSWTSDTCIKYISRAKCLWFF